VISLSTALRVADIFWPPFVEQDGCVFIASEVRGVVDLSKHGTRTAAESFYNHRHVIDLFRHAIPGAEAAAAGYWVYDESHPDFERAWEVGRRLAEMLAAKLRADFPGRPFRVYLTRRDTPIVRFHALRPDEASWLSHADIARGVAERELFVIDTADHV
jgi:hypothetical protein